MEDGDLFEEDLVFKQDVFTFHAGFCAGGSFVFNDPDNKLTIGYTMNNMSSEMMNMKREVNIRDSVYKTIINIG